MSKTELFYPTYDNFITSAAGKKILYTFFHFLCWQGIWVHNSGQRWDSLEKFDIRHRFLKRLEPIETIRLIFFV